MQIQIPPAFFHFIGIVLVVFGALRAYHLGWKRRGHLDGSDTSERGRREMADVRRHIQFGILFVVMGLFLVVSTIINTRR